VKPAAVVGCSRSGKSRLLREYGKLCENTDTMSLISFNDKTPVDKEEGDSSKPLESVLARIAHAIAKPEMIGNASLHCEGKLQFKTTEGKEWMSEGKFVPLTDELNQSLLNHESELASQVGRFLKRNF